MKESISAAASYVRSRSIDFGIEPPLFDKRDIHVHVPEGATPKDGPSAGIAMATVIVSVLTGIPIRRDIAMTGEVTLRGRVLPIGGLKEKLLAALRGGLKKVLIPEENAKDLAEIPDSVKNALEIVPVSRMDEVLRHALMRQPKPIQWEEDVAAPAKPAGRRGPVGRRRALRLHLATEKERVARWCRAALFFVGWLSPARPCPSGRTLFMMGAYRDPQRWRQHVGDGVFRLNRSPRIGRTNFLQCSNGSGSVPSRSPPSGAQRPGGNRGRLRRPAARPGHTPLSMATAPASMS